MKKLLLFTSIFLFFDLALEASEKIPLLQFDENILKKNAEQYGNKTANLMELQKITAALNETVGKQNRFDIPAIFGISHAEVVEYLSKQSFLDKTHKNVFDYISEQWKDFIFQQKKQTSTVLRPEARASLQNIQNAILNAFNPDKKNLFIIKDSTRMQSLETFLKEHHKNLFMVRSTGREDSKEFANAGGNESITAVSPSLESTTKAMGEVVASYFSEKSIGQRLIGAPEKVFEPPFMPVLLQVMVGEEENKIPTSGVMFSQEAEGPTPGVAALQATYGHNEGVVNGLVPVDTFYIGPTKIIHPLIRIKTERLKPGQFFNLERAPNPITWQQIPCLDKQALLDLKTCADFIENYYEYPVDIEFVKLGDTINLVQTRPIVQQSIKPSYLNNKFIDATPQDLKLPITVIGAGGSTVRTIASKDNVIISENIRQALDMFINTQNKDGILAVIIGELAPATSHEATNFRGAGKPVIYFPDVDKIQALANDAPQKPLLIDVQREIIIQFKPTQEFTDLDKTIDQGWLTHPIAKKTSLLGQFWTAPTSEEEEAIKPALNLKNIKFPQLIEALKNGTDEQSILAALKTILYHIQTIISQEIKKSPNSIYKNQLKHIFAQAITCAVEIYRNIPQWTKSKQTSDDHIQWLYPLTFLQAIINQIPLPKEFVANYSLLALIKMERQELVIKKNLGLEPTESIEYITQYAKAERYALTDTLSKDWEKYLQGFSSIKDPQIQQQFANMIYDLQQLDLIPIWLNLSFATAWKDDQNPESVTKKLLKEYSGSKEFLDELHAKKQQIEDIVISNWESPEKFKKMLSSFKEIFNYFTDDNFIKKYEKSEILAKNAALGVMNQLVNTFDLSIKTLQASNSYADLKVKTTNFATMLENYFELLKTWSSIPNIQMALNQMLQGTFKTDEKKFSSVKDYFDTIFDIVSSSPKNNPSQLQGSSNFNVAAATLGSKAAWGRSIGDNPTLDDMFTLIHQNLLVLLATLSNQAGLEQIDLPHIVKQLKNELGKLFRISLIGVTLDNKYLILYFNLPIQHHSNTFEIIYDLANKETILETKFLGDTLQHQGRWEKIAAILPLISIFTKIQLEKPPFLDAPRGLLLFRWKVESEKQALISVELLKAFLSEIGLEEGLPILKQLISITTPDNPELFFNELLKSVPENPYLILYLPDIISFKPKPDQIIKEMVSLLPEIAHKASPELITYILDLIKLLQNKDFIKLSKKYLTPSKLFNILINMVASNKLQLILIKDEIGNIVDDIPQIHLLEIAQSLTKKQIINQKVIGLYIFSELVSQNFEIRLAANEALKYISDNNEELHLQAIEIIEKILNNNPYFFKNEKIIVLNSLEVLLDKMHQSFVTIKNIDQEAIEDIETNIDTLKEIVKKIASQDMQNIKFKPKFEELENDLKILKQTIQPEEEEEQQ